MSVKIAITGGIGSGKSVVSHIFRSMGIPVYDSDSRARGLMCTDAVIRRDLVALLGSEVYQPDGSLDKVLLAHYLFASPAHVREINAIVHPRVRGDFQIWAGRQQMGNRVVAMESAILYEASFEREVDQVWLVTAPLELRLQRAVSRDGSTPQKVRERMAHQLSEEELRSRADLILENDGCKALLPQVLYSLVDRAGWRVS